jgi:hypothetical protein
VVECQPSKLFVAGSIPVTRSKIVEKMNENRLIRDGLVAVLYSPGYGAGWYTVHYIEELLYDPSIVLWVESDNRDKIEHYMALKYPDVYLGGLDNLSIRWVPEGTMFRLDEYDGSESISLKDEEHWFKA